MRILTLLRLLIQWDRRAGTMYFWANTTGLLDEKSPITHSVLMALLFLPADKNTKNDNGNL